MIISLVILPIGSSLMLNHLDLNYRVDLPGTEVDEMLEHPLKPYNLKTMLDFDEVCP